MLYSHILRLFTYMPGRQAKTLSSADVNDLLVFASCTRNPPRNRVIVLLSAKAGLRAGEIANLKWNMVLDASGQIGCVLELHYRAAKKGSGRMIPIHPELRSALENLRRVEVRSEHVVTSERGRAMTASSIVIWFNRAFRKLACKAAHPIRAAERLSRARRGWCTKQAARCAMCSCSPGIGQFRPRSGTSTATAMRSASSCR